MPIKDRQRRREESQRWNRRNPRKRARPERVVGEDENWLVIECQGCFAFFDAPIPRGPGGVPSKCDECKRLRRKIAANLRPLVTSQR